MASEFFLARSDVQLLHLTQTSRVLLNNPKKENIALLDVLHKYCRGFITFVEAHDTMTCFLPIVVRWTEGAATLLQLKAVG
jgi:hypothetical protein